MPRAFPLLICLAALATGCGQTEEAFNKSFDESFKSSCVASATQGPVPADVAVKICDCAADKINKKYSATDKMTMSPDEALPLMQECLKSVVPQ